LIFKRELTLFVILVSLQSCVSLAIIVVKSLGIIFQDRKNVCTEYLETCNTQRKLIFPLSYTHFAEDKFSAFLQHSFIA